MDEALDREVVEAVRRFVDRDVIPAASELEHNDEYPHALVAQMKELGCLARRFQRLTAVWALASSATRGSWPNFRAAGCQPGRRDQQPSDHGLHHREPRDRSAETVTSCRIWRRAKARRSRPDRAACRQRRKSIKDRRDSPWRQLRPLRREDVHHQFPLNGTMLAVAAKTDPKANRPMPESACSRSKRTNEAPPSAAS